MDTRDSWEGDPICKTCGEEMEMSEVHEGYVCLKDHLKEEKDMHVCKGKCWYGLCPDLGD
jgi:hypothetical protein